MRKPLWSRWEGETLFSKKRVNLASQKNAIAIQCKQLNPAKYGNEPKLYEMCGQMGGGKDATVKRRSRASSTGPSEQNTT